MAIISILLASVVGFLVISLLRVAHRVWWSPSRMQKKMAAQGIRGPPYKFLHGNMKEAAAMAKEAVRRPMGELSHDITPRVQPYLQAWINTYGKNILTWQGTLPQLIITEPELIKEVLNNKEGAYKKPTIHGFIGKILGDGLVTTYGKKWARQRKLAVHAFHAESIKGMIPALVASVEDMLKKWEDYDGKEIDLYNEFHVMTSDVISRTAFGSSYVEGKDVFTKIDKLVAITARNTETTNFPFLRKLFRSADEKEADIAEHEIREIIIRFVKQREERNRMGQSDGYGNDLLGLLVKANHERKEDERISLQDVIDECKTFYSTGQETTANFLSFAALLLATNTDWQDKARKEAEELFRNLPPTSDDTKLGRLKIMTMILNESLRLYAPVVTIIRKVWREVRLGKLILPAGMEVVISPLIIHHDPQLWGEDAHLFKPERFSEGVAGATNNTLSFIPFGAGPRICVGQSLALMEAKVALSMLLQRYSFTISPGYVHAPIRHVTTRPQYGMQVILHKL